MKEHHQFEREKSTKQKRKNNHLALPHKYSTQPSMSEYFEYKFYNGDKTNCDKCLSTKTILYNKNDPSDRSRALVELKNLIGESMDFALKDKSCTDDDEFLLRFLFTRKFLVSEAFKLLIAYLDYKQRNVEILRSISALNENIQLALRDGFPTIIPQRDRKGRKMLVFFAANWNPVAFSLETVYRALLLSLEKLLEDIQNQANGFVLIVDWTDFTYKQTSHLNPKVLKLIIEGLQVSAELPHSPEPSLIVAFSLQDCFPGRFKQVHFLSQPWYVEATLAFIRPFLKEKTRERLILHGANLATLHDSISKDVLPTELGGETQSINPLDWVHTLMESSQVPKKQQSYRLTQSPIYSQPPKDYFRPTSSN